MDAQILICDKIVMKSEMLDCCKKWQSPFPSPPSSFLSSHLLGIDIDDDDDDDDYDDGE